MKRIYSFLIFIAVLSSARAQSSDMVSQLIASENYFGALVKQRGIKKAFLKVCDDNSIVFKPGPVSALKHYAAQPDSIKGYLTWEPVYARIAKSGDWGFTTGPYTYKESDSSATASYGNYVSIWKKNNKGVWKLAVDLGITHKRPLAKPVLNFSNPKNEIFLHQRSQSRLQQREDIVFSSDKLMATILKADNKIAQKEFFIDESRLLFPGFEPIVGKQRIAAFWEKQGFKALSTPVKADRSYSGEIAYTHGDATISQKGKTKQYHYVRIWEVQPGYVWKVILEIYTEAAPPQQS